MNALAKMFELIPSPSRRMLRVNLRGHWDLETLARYEVAIRDEMTAPAAGGPYTAFLIDTTDYPIQLQEVAAAHETLLIAAGRREGARVAMLMPNSLSKLQASRIAANAGQRTFATEAEAMDWLFPAR